MKKIVQYITILTVIAAPSFLKAQGNKPYDMMVNGVKVIVQPSGNDIVVVQTVIKGGVQNYPAAKPGLKTWLCRRLVECGTQIQDKNSFKDKLDLISAQVNGDTGVSYASIVLNCIKADFETAWPLYTEAMTIAQV